MPKSSKTIILIALMTLVSACGPAATAVPPSATVISAAPTTAPPTDTPGLPTATTVPLALTPTLLPPTPTSKTSAQGFLLEGVGFRTPESVLYDPKATCIWWPTSRAILPLGSPFIFQRTSARSQKRDE